MENENANKYEQNKRINENDTKHATHIPESVSDKLYDSIVRIEKENEIGTGFFIKIIINGNAKKFIFTCCHVLDENDISFKKTVSFFYGKKYEEKNFLIKLNQDERFIKCYEQREKDVTVIEVLEKDKIPENKFLIPDLSYKYGYDIYKNGKFILAGYPNDIIYEKERHLASGEIKDIKDFEFSHTLQTSHGSSGSPICLFNNIQVIGIHKQGHRNKPINYGTFIGIIIDDLEKNYPNLKKIKPIYNNSCFFSLEYFSSEENLNNQIKIFEAQQHQSKDNYLLSISDLEEYINSHEINGLSKQYLKNLMLFEDIENNYERIIENYTDDYGIWKDFDFILKGEDKALFDKYIYFLAGFLKSLISVNSKIHLKNKCELYHGDIIEINDLIDFENNINEIICFKPFICGTSIKRNALSYIHRKTNKIKALFIINYEYKNYYIPECFDISVLSKYKMEQERLFCAFTFFKIIKVVKLNEEMAEIYLNYIGKHKNLETRLTFINHGYAIQYNSNKNMIESVEIK